MEKVGLVSVIIPNFNHARYLRESLESAFNQTYKNIEVVFLDNGSSDNSIEIAKEYLSRGLRICRNVYNIFNRSYKVLANALTEGEYLMLLPADDSIQPNFIEICVNALKQYPTAGYVHVERDFIDDSGNIIEEEPFYKCSFFCKGRDVMPVYMMTTVAHPVQGLFKRKEFEKINGYERFIEHANADKALWYYLSGVSDYVYIRRKLARVRLGAQTDTVLTVNNFQHPLLIVLTIMDFISWAEENGNDEVIKRKQPAFDKIAQELLQSSAVLLLKGNYIVVQKYLTFCKIISEKVENFEVYIKIADMVRHEEADIDYINALLNNKKRNGRNYDPPSHYEEISDICYENSSWRKI